MTLRFSSGAIVRDYTCTRHANTMAAIQALI